MAAISLYMHAYKQDDSTRPQPNVVMDARFCRANAYWKYILTKRTFMNLRKFIKTVFISRMGTVRDYIK